MQLGMLGLGRMGANMVRRLLRGGHECVVHDHKPDVVEALAKEGASGAISLREFAGKLIRPRAVWLMVPAAAVDAALQDLLPLLEPGDIVIDGGNSFYRDDIRRTRELGNKGIRYVDVGVSGGVYGFERGYCQMIGGERDTVAHLDAVFASLAPPADSVLPTPGRADTDSTAGHGYLHCGPAGAGHFVKMVHNGIEYGLMAAYAEGFNLLHHANRGSHERASDAETAPLAHAESYQYEFDVAGIAELWRRGSVIGSWLLDLIARALREDPALDHFAGRVSDSGEGRWALQAAVDTGVPAPVLSAALFARFGSRGEADFANRLLSALRHEFGGHAEKEIP
ncbi:MAG: decarboxylating 6-phosphogluconate dehydrogenase [Gammaproteobacteria bacterium]|nr:decarboxylating 6-phosphogluconate dehydrogenase [Gammaproteobacteria bacterium]